MDNQILGPVHVREPLPRCPDPAVRTARARSLPACRKLGLTGEQASAAPLLVGERWDIVGTAVAVHAQDRAEHGKLKPAQQQLAKIRVRHVVGHEPADIRGPLRSGHRLLLAG